MRHLVRPVRRHSFLLTALLIALLAALPAVSQPGLLNTRGGGDSPFLLQRLHQLSAALADGHFPVRWMPDANYGFGYPFYNFYAPLSIYIAALFRFLGFSYVRAIHLAQLSGFLVAGGGMFLLARRWLDNDWAALLASAAYSLAPFHLVNVYVRGDSLAEFWAMAFYPLILLAASDLFDRPAALWSGPWRRQLGFLGLSYAALILSHNISALIFTPFLGLYILLRLGLRQHSAEAPGKLFPGALIGTLAGLLLALGLAAWFFLPALVEQDFAQLGPVTAGYFHYSNHFRGLDLVQQALLFDYDVAGGQAFRMGLLQALAAAAGLVALWVGRERVAPAVRYFIPLALLVASLMITPLSRPLWDHLPLLSFTQFPWRFLSVQALATALPAGGLALPAGRRLIVPAVTLVLLVASLARLQPDHLRLTDADVTAERLAAYEWFTGNIGTTVSAEYLPPTAQPRPFTSPWLTYGDRNWLQATSGELNGAELLDRLTTSQSWLITTGSEGATITFPTLYWPGWRATIGEEPTVLQPAPGSGLIRLQLPPGEHTVILQLGRTTVRALAEFLSLGAALLLIWLLWPAVRHRGRRWLFAAAAVGLLATGLHLWPTTGLPAADLTWDFDQLGYLHHDPEIRFNDGTLLTGYQYSDEIVTPGAELTITLQWRGTGAPPATLSLVTPAANRYNWAPVFAAETEPVQPGATIYRFTLPDTVPAGLLLPRLTQDGTAALTPSGQPRGALFLRPLRLAPHASVAEVPETAGLAVRPGAINLRPDDALDVPLQWWTDVALEPNYHLSLRLTDATGVVARCADGPCQLDVQPGYGFRPSSGWPAQQWVNDWLVLPPLASDTLTPPYALTVRLYDPLTETALLTRRLGELVPGDNGRLQFHPSQPVFSLPDTITAAEATFHDDTGPVDQGAVVRLRGYDDLAFDEGNNRLSLTLYWEALGTGREDYTHFVHLVDPTTGTVVAQHDAMPRHNSYPTSQWTTGEIVSDPVVIDLNEVPAGPYRLVVGLYRAVDGRFPRLSVHCPAGDGCEDGQRLLIDSLPIE